MKDWSRKFLLQAVLLNSLVNVVVPALIAIWIDIRLVAVWLSLRAGVNLAVAAIPSPAHALLATHAEGELIERDDARMAAVRNYAMLLSLLCGLGIFILCSAYPLTAGFAWQAALYGGLFFLVSALSVAFRLARDGQGMRRLALAEFVLSLLVLPLIFFGFEWFLLGASAKEAIRVALVASHFTNRSLRLPRLENFLGYGPQYLRGIVQVATQYAERLAFPVIFGAVLAGSLGLGSTLGVALTILSSNMVIWAFREIGVGNERAIKELQSEWATLILAASGLAWFINGVATGLGFDEYADPIVAAGAGFTALMGVNFLATVRSSEALRGSRALLVHLAVVFLSYFVIVVTWQSGNSAVMALAAAAVLQLAYAMIMGPRSLAFFSMTIAALISYVGFAFLANDPTILWPLSVVVGVSLGAPYFIAKVASRRVF